MNSSVNEPLKPKNIFSVENTHMSVEQALAFVAHSSTYQKRTILMLAIGQIGFSFLVMGFPFLFKGPVFLCESEDGSYIQCEEHQSCNSINGPSIEVTINSVTNDFDLWCGRKSYVALAGSLLFLGQTLAGFIFPQLSAQKGRQWCLMFACGITAIPLVLAAALRSFLLLLVALFLGGLGQSGYENESYVLLSEISGEKFRNFSQVILSATWGASQILFALTLRFVQDWRAVTAFIIACKMFFEFKVPTGVTILLIFQFVFESPRYLVAQRMYDHARYILNKMAQINGRPHFYYKFENEADQDPRVFNKTKQTRSQQKTFKRFLTRQLMIKSKDIGSHDNVDRLQALAQSYSHLDLFRFRSLRILTFLLLLLWTFRYQTYFGLSMSLLSLGDDIEDNFFFLAISEVLACLISVTVKIKFNRVPSMLISGLISAIASILIFFPHIPLTCFHLAEGCYQKGLMVTLAMLVKFSITIFGDVLVTYTTEVYPTVVRSMGFGLCVSIGKIGSIFVPFLVSWFQYYEFNPLIIFGGIGLLALYGLRYIPETHNISISDYIEETLINEKPLVELQVIE